MRRSRIRAWLRHICFPPCMGAAALAVLWLWLGNDYREFTAGINAGLQRGSPACSYTPEPDASGDVSEDSAVFSFDLSEEDAAEDLKPSVGERYGWISSEDIDLQSYLYYGDTPEILDKGIGQYTGSVLPGGGGTILACGHASTFCGGLSEAVEGNRLQIQTGYGTFVYEVTKTKIAEAADTQACRLDSGEEQLVLYTCYPFDKKQKKGTKRYFVYCRRVSGSAEAGVEN